MNPLVALNIQLDGIHCESIEPAQSMLELGAAFADLPGTVILLSGGETDSARYHIIAANPWLTMMAQGKEVTITSGTTEIHTTMDPFDRLKQLLKACHISLPMPIAPVSAGFFGYLAYDLKDHLETLPQTTLDDLNLPQLCLYAPAIIVIHDKHENRTNLCIPKRIVNGRAVWEQDRQTAFQYFSTTSPTKPSFTGNSTGLSSTLTHEEYIQAVLKIKDYIAAGDIYQVNMSQRFETDFTGNPYALFQALYHINPAPFYAYINAGDHHVVSTSPERFILRDRTRVETRPIKGTRPRGKTAGEDEKMAAELRHSKKDDAELSMIVDLLRNDIGKVCQAGSVVVAHHKNLEAYDNVYHLVSIVEGDFRSDQDSVDLIKATFPGGSITGCPKIRSMEIIDELEPLKRHIYTGSIGYIGFQDTMDLSIAIRTATIKDNRIYFSVGGGVVYDSDPKDEFEETLHKGRSLMEVFPAHPYPPPKKRPTVWMNGRLKRSDQALIPVEDWGVQYGFGFFETICVRQGRPQFLDAHIRRFEETWRQLFTHRCQPLAWHDIIFQVIKANGLEDCVAACKIMATYGTEMTDRYNGSLVVTARPYVHRLEALNANGLRLGVYPHPRLSPLADHKTLNYLYYLLAGKWAKQNDLDEAIILNPDHSISETNTANLLVIKSDQVLQPRSFHVLPGIMERIVIGCLTNWGYHLQKTTLTPSDRLDVDGIILTNALMGAVPVLSIDGKQLPNTEALCAKINQTVYTEPI